MKIPFTRTDVLLYILNSIDIYLKDHIREKRPPKKGSYGLNIPSKKQVENFKLVREFKKYYNQFAKKKDVQFLQIFATIIKEALESGQNEEQLYILEHLSCESELEVVSKEDNILFSEATKFLEELLNYEKLNHSFWKILAELNLLHQEKERDC